MLKLKRPPGITNRVITLPSSGYPYREFPDLKGGKINVKAFNYEIESLMYGTSGDNTAKQYSRLCLLLTKLVEWPKGFNPGALLEGDSAFIIMSARSMTYPEQYHIFDTTCTQCDEKESHNLKIPDQLPQNIYPDDFNGIATFTTFNDNVLEMRFLSLHDDSECLRMSRNRAQKGLISEDMVDVDYQLNRLCVALLTANGDKPSTLEETRDFFKSMPPDERDELMQSIRVHAPGINSRLQVRCPKCNESYETFIPISMDFFRPRSRTIRTELPGGVHIGIPSEEQRRPVNDSTGETSIPPIAQRDQGRGTESPKRSDEQKEKVTRLEPGGDLVSADKPIASPLIQM